MQDSSLSLTPSQCVLSYPPARHQQVFNDDVYKRVSQYAKCDDIMHTMFYGPECSGKLHMARTFITEHTGVDVHNVKRVVHEYKTKDKGFPFYKSSVHFEINVSDFGYSNQKCMVDLIQELSRTLNVSRNTYKIILIRHSEELTQSIQYQLRRMMELIYTTSRLVMLSSSLDRIDTTIQSRLVCVRMPMLSKRMSVAQGAHKMREWLRGLLTDLECIDIHEECVQQLWRVLSKKTKMGVATLRKWTRVIQFTQLPHIIIILHLYNKVCLRYAADKVLHKDLLTVINYYTFMQDVGFRKDFQLEMVLYVLYVAIHNRDVFQQVMNKTRVETH